MTQVCNPCSRKVEAYKRVVLWIILLPSITFNFVGVKDYLYMVEQTKLMKHNFIEDVVGYNYCDTDVDILDPNNPI